MRIRTASFVLITDSIAIAAVIGALVFIGVGVRHLRDTAKCVAHAELPLTPAKIRLRAEIQRLPVETAEVRP